MRVSDEELGELTSLQGEVQSLVHQVGQIEVRKQRLIAEIADREERAQRLMSGAATRLGIPAGTPFRMDPSGDITVEPSPAR